MTTITIPKKEYEQLVDKALRYEYFQSVLKQDPLAPPSSRSTKEVIKELKATKQYSPEFIASLEKGLRRSDYFKT